MTSSLPLAGRSALVTGGGSGIGLASARAVVADGAAVTIAGRSAERLREAAAVLEAIAPPGVPVAVAPCDVADEDDVVRAVEVAATTGDGLDLVVASAGMGTLAPLLDMPLDQWNQVVATNLTGTFLTIKHAGRVLAGSGGGSIVAVSSLAARVTHHHMSPYCASKAAIDTLVRNAADELGVAGIRVNSVQPSLVDTDMGVYAKGEEAILASYLDRMPLARVGTVDDVAALIRFLLGPESSWITGACIPIDGGNHLRGGPDYTPLARALYGDAVDPRHRR